MQKQQINFKDKKTKQKILLNIFIPQVIFLLYIITFIILYFVVGKNNGPIPPASELKIYYFFEWNIFGTKPMAVPAYLSIMFFLELLSTITFQFRLWLTSKDKISIAAGVGATSWLIAGTQGMLLIGDNGDHITFLIKMLPVGIATYVGIYMNNLIYKTKFFNKAQNEIKA